MSAFPSSKGTFNRTLWNWNAGTSEQPDGLFSLLIVPYGIETLHQDQPFVKYAAFNRTLWNWNIGTMPVKNMV